MKFYEITFSPTGGTKKAADILSHELAEHSIARKDAAGRPDSEDEKTLKEMAAQIREKIAGESDHQPGRRSAWSALCEQKRVRIVSVKRAGSPQLC